MEAASPATFYESGQTSDDNGTRASKVDGFVRGLRSQAKNTEREHIREQQLTKEFEKHSPDDEV